MQVFRVFGKKYGHWDFLGEFARLEHAQRFVREFAPSQFPGYDEFHADPQPAWSVLFPPK